INTPLGKIVGAYNIIDSTIDFKITRKPVLVTCKRIEDELRNHLQSPSVTLMDFSLSNFGVVKINKPFSFKTIELADAELAEETQLVTAVITLYIVDDETFGSNETWRGTKKN